MKTIPAISIFALLLLAAALPRTADAQKIKPLIKPLTAEVRTLRTEARIDDRLDARTLIREDTEMKVGSELRQSGIAVAAPGPTVDETVRAARAERLRDDEARVKAAAAVSD